MSVYTGWKLTGQNENVEIFFKKLTEQNFKFFSYDEQKSIFFNDGIKRYIYVSHYINDYNYSIWFIENKKNEFFISIQPVDKIEITEAIEAKYDKFFHLFLTNLKPLLKLYAITVTKIPLKDSKYMLFKPFPYVVFRKLISKRHQYNIHILDNYLLMWWHIFLLSSFISETYLKLDGETLLNIFLSEGISLAESELIVTRFTNEINLLALYDRFPKSKDIYLNKTTTDNLKSRGIMDPKI